MSCTYRYSFVESDLFYVICFHTLSFIQIPLHIYGTYVIAMKSPKSMDKVKYSMMKLHLFSAWFDLFMTSLSIPVFIFPITSGYPLGLLYYIGVPTWFLAYMGFTSVFLLGSAIVMFFENRYHHLIRRGTDTQSIKIKRGIHYFLNYLLSVIIFIPALYVIPENFKARVTAHEKLPCLPMDIINNPRFFMLGTDISITVTCFLIYMTLTSIQVSFFFFATVSFIFKAKCQSKKTSCMQRQFFIALCIQVAVPLIAIIIPASYVIYSIVSGNLDMALSNGSMIWISTHGIFSTVIMLIVHKPYRQATFDILKFTTKI